MVNNRSYHFIGIGGEGMSSLAYITSKQGYKVSGSDIKETSRTKELRREGIEIRIGHRKNNLASDVNKVIISSAIEDNNIEKKEAKRRNIEILPRLRFLSQIIKERFSIGITGTHGKTTTTTMVATLLEKAGLDPTFLIGALCRSLGGNAKLGESRYLVAEIDESDGYFLDIEPQIAVVTNIDKDHLNTYSSPSAIRESFFQFAKNSNLCILNCDDPQIKNFLNEIDRRIITFGIEDGDLRATNIRQNGFKMQFDLNFKEKRVGVVKIPIPGRHNVYNALAAIGVAKEVGIRFDEMAEILKNFCPPERRFQAIRNDGVMIIDDYAHLPREIASNLEAIQNGWGQRRVIAVFQPHRFSRTKYLHASFARSFDLADVVVITDIYPAFENPIPGVDAQKIATSIKQREKNRVYHLAEKQEVLSFLEERTQPGDFIIGFGAGDIWKVIYKFANSEYVRNIDPELNISPVLA